MIGMTVCRAKLHFPNSPCLPPSSQTSHFYSSQLFVSCTACSFRADSRSFYLKANLNLHGNFPNPTVDSFLFVSAKSLASPCTEGQKSLLNLGRNCGLVVTFCHVHEWLGRTLETSLDWISHRKEWPKVTLLTSPSHFYEWTSWAVVSEEEEKKAREQKQDASLWLTTRMNHFSLQMAHPSPGCSSCHSGLSKRFIIFLFSCWCLELLRVFKKSHVEAWIRGSYCCWMSMALKRHFPCGCSRGLPDWIFFFPPSVTGQGRKGVPGIIWGGGRGGRGPVIHNACYLTQHTDLLLTRTGLYLQHQCHHMTTVHDKALFAKKKG